MKYAVQSSFQCTLFSFFIIKTLPKLQPFVATLALCGVDINSPSDYLTIIWEKFLGIVLRWGWWVNYIPPFLSKTRQNYARNVSFTLFCRASKGLIKVFVKSFEEVQRSEKMKIQVNFYFTRQEGLRTCCQISLEEALCYMKL